MKIYNCRLCKTGTLGKPVLDFGKTPLANEFLSTIQNQDLFNLQVCCCEKCGHYQLNESIDPERLFRNYIFVAGTSPVNVEHFRQYAINMVKKLNLNPGDKVLDIASNDGTLLKHFKNLGMQVLGIDPAKNIAKIAETNGIETITEFFTEEYADQMVNEGKLFDLITANNVFAHVPDLENFAKGVKKILAPQGVFSFEVSYFADVCDKMLFDTIYHEHSSYHTYDPLSSFFKRNDMNIFDIERIDTHGGSIRIYIRHNKDIGVGRWHSNIEPKEEMLAAARRMYEIWKQERDIFDYDRQKMKNKVLKLQNTIQNIKYELKEKLQFLKNEGKSIAIYGVPAKATTLMYALDIDENIIDFAIDDNPLKQGTYTPGKHIPVYSSEIIKEKNPDVLLVLAWNFAESIIQNHSDFNGTWIIPLPELKII